MRIVTLHSPEGRTLAVERDNDFFAIEAPTDLSAALADLGPDALLVAAAQATRPTSGRLLAPLRPRKIVAVGLNFLDHIRETGLERPTSPLLFAKFPSSVIGPGDEICIDTAITERVDWEVELAVVIGSTARNVEPEHALDRVFGYSVANDVSARDVQFADGQWIRGKSLDTFCPLGPAVVTAEEIRNPQDLGMSTRVNGDLMQDSRTSEMLFGVADIIAFCSRSFTLEPGDVILTGTPWGCGEFMDPRRSLAAGDVVTCAIEGIGVLENRVVAAASG